MNKQHFIGLIIFSLIVGTAVVGNSFFIKMPDTDSVTVPEYNIKTYHSKDNCRRKKRKKPRKPKKTALINLDQAVYSQGKEEKLKLDLSLANTEKESDQTANVALHFFVSDKYSTRYLKTEYISVFFVDGFAEKELSGLKWLNNLQSKNYLFVISESVNELSDDRIYSPVFNKLKAKPILLKVNNYYELAPID